MQQIENILPTLATDGFILLKSMVPTEQIMQLIDAVESVRNDPTSPGLRNLLNRSEPIRTFACEGIASTLASQMLTAAAVPVRAILFDKTPASNWYVTWHQDLSIPVKNRIEANVGPDEVRSEASITKDLGID